MARQNPLVSSIVVKSLVMDSPDRALNRRLVLDAIRLIFRKATVEEQNVILEFGQKALKAEKVKQRKRV